MQIPGLPFKVSRVKTRVSEHAHYGLTPIGSIKAGDAKIPGPKGRILESLDDGNDMVSEISEDTRYTPEKVKRLLKQLIRDGYVQQLRGD
jgi:DNA-binding MarR family transcriptional regulator